MPAFNAVECRYINDYSRKSTLRGLPHVVYVGGFPKNILGFSKKRKDKHTNKDHKKTPKRHTIEI